MTCEDLSRLTYQELKDSNDDSKSLFMNARSNLLGFYIRRIASTAVVRYCRNSSVV